ncbi:cell wall-active antibiotics response protein LiaF [Cohnella sp. AR92]|uniref:cell wall-active antibiotics response protein LiaF n=1 Tax=Cohnella sp. AR92 TaxID=648716 RepID=UPI000F8C8ED3|nr:cell wall-active antibiotics response protein LiaF [Cohnella sp. AR92]RUS45536.1 cell wall-active antibiotics response protein [Cohnella sp. AR92]
MQSLLHRVFWGIVLVGIGCVFLLNQAGVISIDIGELFSTYWPVILILVGFQGMLLQRKGGYCWNPLLILLALFFLARNLEWIDWELHDLLRFIGPVVLILVGLNLIARGARPKKKQEAEPQWNTVNPPPAPPSEPPIDRGPPPAPEPPEWEKAFGQPEKPKFEEPEELKFEESGEPRFKEPRGSKHEQPRGTKFEEVPFDAPGSRYDSNLKHRYWKEHHHGHHWHGHWDGSNRRGSHSRFIGDFDIGSDYFELRPMSISHFIGDTKLDLTRAQIPVGETRIYVSSFIGDVKVFVPNDFSVGVRVVSSSLIGDVTVMEQKRGGFFNQINLQSPQFEDTAKRIVIIVSTFIGDVRIKKVG